MKRQAQLLGLSRSGVYYRGWPVSARDLELMRGIDELHLEAPFFGARKIAGQLRREGQPVGWRHVHTLMRTTGIQALYRRPRTSIPARGATVYPYLLENMVIERPDQVWSSDLTYLPMAHGLLYLMVILDIASRKVLVWRLLNTMEAAGVAISMDGKGRWIDNIFIERLWRFCAHSRYVAWRQRDPCTGRPRSSLRTHNGAIGDSIRLPTVGQRGDCHAGTLLRQAGVC